jgi:hypothetical protein
MVQRLVEVSDMPGVLLKDISILEHKQYYSKSMCPSKSISKLRLNKIPYFVNVSIVVFLRRSLAEREEKLEI